ncbi:MAG: hypothetical protein WCO56_18870 [Verrucomicrobiota bacterium]
MQLPFNFFGQSWSHYRPQIILLTLGCLVAQGFAVTVQDAPLETTVTGNQYRLTLHRESLDLGLELLGRDGVWHVAFKPSAANGALVQRGEPRIMNGRRATWTLTATPDQIVVGQQAMLDSTDAELLDVHYLCRDHGVLIGTRVTGTNASTILWTPPRVALADTNFDGYLFWDGAGQPHHGSFAKLTPTPAYAGVSAWDQTGDVARKLSVTRPALMACASGWGVNLGVVFQDYSTRWSGSHTFIQRHTPQTVYFYTGYVPVTRAQQTLWAWLAPFSNGEPAPTAAQVEALVREGDAAIRAFKPISVPPSAALSQPLSELSSALRRSFPVPDLNDAVVYTVNEFTDSEATLNLARAVGTDLLIRGWFKWNKRPPVERWREFPQKAHGAGAWFGGGITCSALYDGENGITQPQLLDMATRGPDGQLLNAWDQPGIRHGSLSSPAYLDYLFRWCREQMDAGADYLFMDEHTAVLGPREGYDDYSIRDFRRFLRTECAATREFTPADVRWQTQYQVALSDPKICPGGTVETFEYRAYLAAHGWVKQPTDSRNPLSSLWHSFRTWRDDIAWKTLTGRIRAYAREKGRPVFISANGLARYVDLQVLGVWGQWQVEQGRMNLAANMLPEIRSLVQRGQELAGHRVPVVLFHDWGFGEPPFPYLGVPPSQRELWLRTRAPEIYAAGARFAFPLLGPFGCDARGDGTLPVMVRQTTFYQTHRQLFQQGRYRCSEPLRTSTPNLSLAAWTLDAPRAVVLHVINRNTRDGQLQPQRALSVDVPLDRAPASAYAVSPDWAGERPVQCAIAGKNLRVTLADLDAYALVWLMFPEAMDLDRLKDSARIRLMTHWERPERNEFRVRPDGSVENASALNGILQGKLHAHMRNPPTFLVDAAKPETLSVHVRAVSTAGGRLEYRVDDRIERAVDLPDLDHKNDTSAAEYDKVIVLPIPAGKHRVTLDNTGADWLVLS